MNHIIKFQQNNGLVADGIIGKNTLIKMRCVWKIATDAQLAHFLANTHHETGGFTVDTENLNYRPSGLAKTWPSRYADNNGNPNALALKLAGNPKALANNVYSNRNGNGNEESGDGWKFIGRGAIHTTGRKNYQTLSDFVNDPLSMTNPELVANKYFWESGLCYFTKGNLWERMKYTSAAAVKDVRKAVNGGYTGLEDVQKLFTHYYGLITK